MKIDRNSCVMIAALSLCAWGASAHAAENPMGRVGIEHNAYLACVMQAGVPADTSPLATLVEHCGFDPGMSVDDLVQKYAFMVEAHVGVGVAEGAAAYRDYFTEYEFSFITRIDSILALDADERTTDALLAGLEDEAVIRLNSTSRSGQALLAAISTARHSVRYRVVQSDGGSAGQRFPWDIVGADLLGALGGTLIGGPLMGTAIGVACSAAAGERSQARTKFVLALADSPPAG
jgi:hypothetical protein